MAKQKPSKLVLRLSIALTIFGIATWLAAAKTMLFWEQNLFFKIYDWPEVLHSIFLVITQLGSVWMVLGVAFFWFLKHRENFVLFILGNAAATWVLVTLTKYLVERPRPDVLLNVKSYDTLATGFGFPSGHAAVATTVALTILPKVPKFYRPWIIGGVGLVALSRVNLGVHGPLDVVAGTCLGAVVTLLSQRIFIRFFKT